MRKADMEWLPLRALLPHPVVQRQLIKARVKHLSSAFSPDGLGILEIWLTEGTPYIIDGQHRWQAGMDTGHGDLKVRCRVHRNATLQEMAALFLLLNDSRFVSPIDRFNVALVAEDARCTEIAAIVREFGMKVAASSSDGSIRCVDRLFTLYDRDPDLLRDVLRTATAAWGTRSVAVENVILGALGTVLGTYNGQLDRASFVQRLAKYKGGPSGILGNARALKEIRPITVTRAAAEILVASYNQRRRGGELPPL